LNYNECFISTDILDILSTFVLSKLLYSYKIIMLLFYACQFKMKIPTIISYEYDGK